MTDETKDTKETQQPETQQPQTCERCGLPAREGGTLCTGHEEQKAADGREENR